jgi:hypothetical protein
MARDTVADVSLDCDGGTTQGTKDKADIDIADSAPVRCETVTHP